MKCLQADKKRSGHINRWITRLREMMIMMVLGVFLMGWETSASAGAIDPYPFQNEEDRDIFRSTILELRCPKCQNQSIADSSAPIAHDMRKKVYEQVIAGKSQAEIVSFMVERYGDFVTYRPPVRPSTFLLWAGPPLLVLIAIGVLVVRHRGRAVLRIGETDPAEVNRILHQYGQDDAGEVKTKEGNNA